MKMGLFSRKTEFCQICNKELTHKHKPKKEWGIEGPLCGDCHVNKSIEFYEGKVRQPCAECGTTRKVTDLWEPRWQWDIEGLLCKECFDKKEKSFDQKKNFCSQCGGKMRFVRYRPKPKWKIEGELCRKCWDIQKAKFG